MLKSLDYNWTSIDKTWDYQLSLGVVPLVELSFMPCVLGEPEIMETMGGALHFPPNPLLLSPLAPVRRPAFPCCFPSSVVECADGTAVPPPLVISRGHMLIV